MKRKRILLVAVVTLALGTGLILLHQLRGAEPAGGPGGPAGARGGVQKAASGPGPGTQPASGPAFDANDPDVKLLVKGLNEFAIDLYKQIAKKEKGNIFISPFSISCALAMTYAGARGETAQQMAKALHFPPELLKDDAKRLHAAFGRMIRITNGGRDQGEGSHSYRLLSCNAVWCADAGLLTPDFLGLCKNCYGSEAKAIAGGTEGARRSISAWAQDKTGGRIVDLLPEMHSEAAIVLTNATWFKAPWTAPFDPNRTKTSTFFVTETKTVEVPLMMQQRRFSYVRGKGYATAAIPYGDEDAAMVVLLPDRWDGLTDIHPTPQMLEDALDSQSAELSLSLPRFRAGFGVDLVEALRNLGMTRVISQEADLSGMVRGGGLRLGAALHKAFVKVDEKGTEAAAGTALSIVYVFQEQPRRFAVDRPFLYAIVDTWTGCILFIGRELDPSAE